jgi:hypothetical protein
MAKKSAAQQRRAAETTQQVSGQARVDAKVQIGKRQWRRLSEVHPSLQSATEALSEGGFQGGTITSPSGVQVQVSRPKGGAAGGSAYRVRAPEFGDQGYPSARTGMAGAAPGEARWRVHRPRGANIAGALAAEAEQVRSQPNPVASHPTVGRIKSLVGVPSNEAEEHANRLEARKSRQEAMDLDNEPSMRGAAQTMVRAAGTLAQRQRNERVGAQRKVAKAAVGAAQRDPSIYEAVMAETGRQQRAQRLDTRARNLSAPETQEHLRWAGVPRTGAPGGDNNPASVPAGSTRQHTQRAREMQGYVHTQQAGTDLRRDPDYMESQAWVRESGGQGPVGEAGKRVSASLRAANRQRIRQNAVPMDQTVGRAPSDVVEAAPMTERVSKAASPLPQSRGTNIRNSNPPASANTPKIAPAQQTVTRPPQRPVGGGTTESALANARAEVAKRAGK